MGVQFFWCWRRTCETSCFFSMHSLSVEMTRPSVSSDWLMFLRSRSRASPALPLPLSPPPAVLAHSEPARSTRCSLPVHSIVEVPSDV